MDQQMLHEGSNADRDVEFYDAKVLGAPFKVILRNGVKEVFDSETGKTLTEIEDLTGLIAAVVMSRVLHPRKLSGAELRFIRSALCMKSREVAEKLDVSPEHYSRCEAGGALAASTEKIYRLIAYWLLSTRDTSKEMPEAYGEALEQLRALNKIFLEMKIDPVHSAGEELTFEFVRTERHACNDADERWQPPIAA